MNRCHDFLGDEVSGSGADRVYIVPVPIERTTSYRRGTVRGPEAIIEASRQIELFNAARGIDLEGSGIVTLREEIRNKDELISFIAGNRENLLGAFTCFIGGEHSITPWILEALRLGDTGIVWLDAHADLRERYLGDRESHACAARNSMRYGPVVEVGVRSYCREEKDFLENAKGVRLFGRWDEKAMEAVRRLPANIYLSIDFDAVDPSIIRAVGTPEPGGLIWGDLVGILDFLFVEKNVLAMDAVELCPDGNDVASDFIAAKIIYEAVSRFLMGEV
jgi:agmatinase